MLERFRRQQSPDTSTSFTPKPIKPPNTFGLYNRMLTQIGQITYNPASEEIAMQRAADLAAEIAKAPQKEQDQIIAAVIRLRKHQERLGRVNGLPDTAEELLRSAGVSQKKGTKNY